jgi:hypothetical protein
VKHLTALLLCTAFTVCPALADSDEPSQGQLLSAFFGLDDSRRIRVRTSVACRGIPGGDEIGAAEVGLYRIYLRQADGTVVAVTPMAVGDLNDNDNNHELCLDVEGEPLSVSFPAGAVTDPNEDLNPDTEIDVSAPVSN